MQRYPGLAERVVGPSVSNGPKAASPLQEEIEHTKKEIAEQSMVIEKLSDKLSPYIQPVPATDGKGDVPDAPLSEVTSKVRDCRHHVQANTRRLMELIERTEL